MMLLHEVHAEGVGPFQQLLEVEEAGGCHHGALHGTGAAQVAAHEEVELHQGIGILHQKGVVVLLRQMGFETGLDDVDFGELARGMAQAVAMVEGLDVLQGFLPDEGEVARQEGVDEGQGGFGPEGLYEMPEAGIGGVELVTGDIDTGHPLAERDALV